MKIFSNGSKCLTVIGLVAISNMMTALVAAKPLAADSQASSRRDAVKQAMQHAWEGYRRYAFDSDELQPLSKTSTNNWGGWEMTILDSLDTLYVMGMMDEFVEAREKVNNIDFRNTATGGPISFFETTIRALGGLISAYDLSGDKIFLEQAQVLADSLSTA
ncbi:Mannosyl-oligosaccharide 1,2-alpha-mannosidase IB, partial [Spiromyces aspiralis]